MKVTVNKPKPSAPTFTVELTEDEAEQLFALVGTTTRHPSLGWKESSTGKLYHALMRHFGSSTSDRYEVVGHPLTGVPCVARK